MIDPYGGHLVDRLVSPAERARREGERRDLPLVTPSVDQQYDAEKLGIGAYSPLDGFMDGPTLRSIVTAGRLPNGLPWTIPIHFPVPDDPKLRALGPGDDVGIVAADGGLLAILHIRDKFSLDRPAIARGVYGTEDPTHPNVGDLLGGPDTAWGGPIDLLRRLPVTGSLPEFTPAEARAEFARRGWHRVAAYQCRNPPHTAHEHIQRLTLEREDVDGLFVHPVVGRLKKGDYRREIILEAYDALVKTYYPPDRVALSPFTISMRYGGPKAALFLAIVRRNFGCQVYIVGRDQAGVGKFYDPFACHRIFDEFDIGITPARYDESFFCRKCGGMASRKVCPHSVEDRVATSQTRIRAALMAHEPLPTEILRPEVAAVLGRPGAELTQ